MDQAERKSALRKAFTEARGYWSEAWDLILDLDADFFEAYLDLSAAPWRHGTLEPKIKELIYIAIDSSTTHLHGPGLRVHVRNALRHGATRDEIMEVFELTSVLGIHACSMGIPALIDEVRQTGRGHLLPSGPLSPAQEALKRDFQAKRGYWTDLWEGLIRLDPQFFAAYTRFSALPWTKGPLPPKVKELIYIAIDSATTHLYEPGTRIHMRNALAHGATLQEIVEVLELVSVLGIHTVTLGAQILAEELAKLPAAAE